VEYRLAPESPFPASVNDAIDAVRLIGSNIEHYVDCDAPIILVGDSAGGTLAAVAAAATRGDEITIAAQILIYPTLGPEMVTESSHRFGSGFLLDNDQLRLDYAAYLGDFTDHVDQRVSPLMALDLTGSPPAIVVIAECDPLRDEAIAYAGLLEHFSTPVEILEAQGMVHGFLMFGAVVPDALAILDDLATHLHRIVEAAS
jgi:acetyl esterase